MQIIYIDILFMINLIMDWMIFFVAMNILGKEVQGKKIIFGSLVAALQYCLIIYIPLLQQLPIYIYYFFIPVIPILYIFSPNSTKEFLRIFVVCTLSAFVIGGGSFSFYYLISQLNEKSSMTALLPLVMGGLICGIVTLSFKWFRKRVILPYFEYEIIVCNLHREEKISGIIDTGNCLYTVMEKKPVTVVNYQSIKHLLGEQERVILEECCKVGIIEMLGKQTVFNKPIYIIPFKSIGCKEGILIGIEVEKVKIIRENQEKILTKSIIGVCFEPIFKECKYQALIHPDLIIN